MATHDEMTGMYKESVIPIYWSEWEIIDTSVLEFLNVTFYENFGPFREGDFYPEITVDYENGVLSSYDHDAGVVDKQVKFKAIPIDDEEDFANG